MSIVEHIRKPRRGTAEVPSSEVREYRSRKLVVECKCGERLVLIGREEDWRWGRVVLECGGCEERFVLL